VQANHAWLLTLIESMRAEWGCTLRDAMFREGLLAAIDLWPALLARHGSESRSMDPVTKARQKAKEEMRRYLAANYEIIG
jgi:hypothetical protein